MVGKSLLALPEAVGNPLLCSEGLTEEIGLAQDGSAFCRSEEGQAQNKQGGFLIPQACSCVMSPTSPCGLGWQRFQRPRSLLNFILGAPAPQLHPQPGLNAV